MTARPPPAGHRSGDPVPRRRRPATCWVSVGDGERHWASGGRRDRAAVRRPAPDGRSRLDAESVPIATLHRSRRRGRRCRCCGTARDGEPDRHRLRLPAQPRPAVRPRPAGVPAGVRRAAAGTAPAAEWVRANIEYALAQADASPLGPRRVRPGCPSCSSSRSCGCTSRRRRPPTTAGWPPCAIRCSARRWRGCTPRPSASGRSPSWRRRPPSRARLLDERFRQVLGRSPIRYLTEWRMHVAEDLLASTDLGVAQRRPPRRLRRRGGVQPRVQAGPRCRRPASGGPAFAAAGPTAGGMTRGTDGLPEGDHPCALRARPRPRPRATRPPVTPWRRRAASPARRRRRLTGATGWPSTTTCPRSAATNPPVLIAMIAAATERIRVGSGGVMLPNHAPLVVAEQFALLEAAYPGRIDLGIGRAPGTDPVTGYALRHGGGGVTDDAVEQFPSYVDNILTMMSPGGAGLQVNGRLHPLNATPAGLLRGHGLAAGLLGLLRPARSCEGAALRLRPPLLRQGDGRGPRALPLGLPAVGAASRAADLPHRQRRRRGDLGGGSPAGAAQRPHHGGAPHRRPAGSAADDRGRRSAGRARGPPLARRPDDRPMGVGTPGEAVAQLVASSPRRTASTR